MLIYAYIYKYMYVYHFPTIFDWWTQNTDLDGDLTNRYIYTYGYIQTSYIPCIYIYNPYTPYTLCIQAPYTYIHIHTYMIDIIWFTEIDIHIYCTQYKYIYNMLYVIWFIVQYSILHVYCVHCNSVYVYIYIESYTCTCVQSLEIYTIQIPSFLQ